MQKMLLLEDDISLIDGLTYFQKKNGFNIGRMEYSGMGAGGAPDYHACFCTSCSNKGGEVA